MVSKKIHPNYIITEEVTQNHPKAEKLTMFELHSEMISFLGQVGKFILFIGRLYKRTDGRPCINLKLFECIFQLKLWHINLKRTPPLVKFIFKAIL